MVAADPRVSDKLVVPVIVRQSRWKYFNADPSCPADLRFQGHTPRDLTPDCVICLEYLCCSPRSDCLCNLEYLCVAGGERNCYPTPDNGSLLDDFTTHMQILMDDLIGPCLLPGGVDRSKLYADISDQFPIVISYKTKIQPEMFRVIFPFAAV